MSLPSGLPRPHRAARLEDAISAALTRTLRRRGWLPRLIPYPGYGTDGWVRVLARVLMAPPGTRRRDIEQARGWRRFLSAEAEGVPVVIEVGDQRYEVTTTRGGYVDEVVAADLEPGWAHAKLTPEGGPASEAPLRVVGPDARLGVVSDVDDTVIVTALPRPLVAFWNSFVRTEASRHPVPGMDELYRELLAENPDAFVVYLSTGAWNVAPALRHFLERHSFPPGPTLMTDWGPTPQGWFRSGREHKRTQLTRLLGEFPQLRWVLVGDDGQHDPELYEETAAAAPEKVLAIAIRQLTATEQVLTHGTPQPPSEMPWAPERPHLRVPEVRAPDGTGLLAALRSRDLIRLSADGG
ncbi:MAG TPA: phosphatase domain-containing protein [Cryptosporangiaceae bacterium]|nr:phosphatase domain-containing protein [Cryptosporangiaceae bacterium]